MSECKYWNNKHKECSISNNTYEQGRVDERERIVEELEELRDRFDKNDFGIRGILEKALEIVRGEE